MAKINYEQVKGLAEHYEQCVAFNRIHSNVYIYEDAMLADIFNAIATSIKEADVEDITDAEGMIEYLDDVLWTNDNVTGNSTAYKGGLPMEDLQKFVCDNWDHAVEAVREFCCEKEFLEQLRDFDYRWIDVTIRCHLLNQQLCVAVERLVQYNAIKF